MMVVSLMIVSPNTINPLSTIASSGDEILSFDNSAILNAEMNFTVTLNPLTNILVMIGVITLVFPPVISSIVLNTNTVLQNTDTPIFDLSIGTTSMIINNSGITTYLTIQGNTQTNSQQICISCNSIGGKMYINNGTGLNIDYSIDIDRNVYNGTNYGGMFAGFPLTGYVQIQGQISQTLSANNNLRLVMILFIDTTSNLIETKSHNPLTSNMYVSSSSNQTLISSGLNSSFVQLENGPVNTLVFHPSLVESLTDTIVGVALNADTRILFSNATGYPMVFSMIDTLNLLYIPDGTTLPIYTSNNSTVTSGDPNPVLPSGSVIIMNILSGGDAGANVYFSVLSSPSSIYVGNGVDNDISINGTPNLIMDASVSQTSIPISSTLDQITVYYIGNGPAPGIYNKTDNTISVKYAGLGYNGTTAAPVQIQPTGTISLSNDLLSIINIVYQNGVYSIFDSGIHSLDLTSTTDTFVTSYFSNGIYNAPMNVLSIPIDTTSYNGDVTVNITGLGATIITIYQSNVYNVYIANTTSYSISYTMSAQSTTTVNSGSIGQGSTFLLPPAPTTSIFVPPSVDSNNVLNIIIYNNV